MATDKKREVVRAVLEGSAKLAYDDMVRQMKTENQFIQVTPSKLVGWIVERFQKMYFNQDRQQMVHQHLNSKEYLRDAIKNATSKEDLKFAVEKALAQIGSDVTVVKSEMPKPKVRKKANEPSVNRESPGPTGESVDT